jgi:uncharacterized membrane protein YccC
MTLRGPRARVSLAAALAVGSAVTLALGLHLQAPFWAGVSAFICLQASQPQSLRKAAHRITGTALAAAGSLLIFPWIAYDHAATLLMLFAAGTFGVLGWFVSSFSYAWLLGGATVMMVVLGALQDPALILSFAFYRAAEIILGSLTALAVAFVLLPQNRQTPPRAPGWRSLLGHNAYMLPHAMRTGLVVALVPVVWRIFELPDLSQMAISIGVIMAVPQLTGDPRHDQAAVVQRAAERVLGCLIGVSAGLLMLALPWAANFPTWLLLLMLAAAAASQLQSGPHAMPSVGTQAIMAFILTAVQGWGPALTMTPAIDRACGMLGAICMLLAINLILGPAKPAIA